MENKKKYYDFILAHRPTDSSQVDPHELWEFKHELIELITSFGIARYHIMDRTVKIWVIPSDKKSDLIRKVVAIACKTGCSFMMKTIQRPTDLANPQMVI